MSYRYQPAEEAPRKRRVSTARWIIGFIIMIPLVSVWGLFLSEYWRTYRVVSGSMTPTLAVGDHVIMRHQNAFATLDNRIIAFHEPGGGSDLLTKRVIASSNSTVSLRQGQLYLDESKIPVPGERIIEAPNKKWSLREDELFVVGDNRNDSYDSIDYGPIHRNIILGVVTYRYWPKERMGKLE